MYWLCMLFFFFKQKTAYEMRISDWSSDVCSSDLENAQHRRQLRTLGRREVRQRLSTPWGLAQSSEIYANGVVFHSTASHGGIKLDRARNMAMPGVLRVAGGWSEEDCEWAKVAIGFPSSEGGRLGKGGGRTCRF